MAGIDLLSMNGSIFSNVYSQLFENTREDMIQTIKHEKMEKIDTVRVVGKKLTKLEVD